MPPEKIKVLITAFGPFGRVTHNISEATLEALVNSEYFQNLPPNIEIITQLLEVDTHKIQTYGELITQHKPDYVIALGEYTDAPTAKMVYEAAAFNCYIEKKDGQPYQFSIEPEGNKVQFGINSKVVFDILKKDNEILEYSYNGGEYGMCNAIYYKLIHEMEKEKPNRTIFLHLTAPKPEGDPKTFDAIAHQGKRNAYIESYTESLEKIIKTMNQLCEDKHVLRHISLDDHAFEQDFIPPADRGARETYENLKYIVPAGRN